MLPCLRHQEGVRWGSEESVVPRSSFGPFAQKEHCVFTYFLPRTHFALLCIQSMKWWVQRYAIWKTPRALVLKLSVGTPQKTQTKDSTGRGKNKRRGAALEESEFFFFRRRDKDKTQQPHWWASPCPPAVGAFKVAETKPDNCWEAAAPRSVGAADRWLTGMRVIKGREGGESVLGQSGCDRGRSLPAVTGHVLPMAPSWTSVSGCQVSQWGSLVALRALISFTGNHCITTNVPSQPVTTALQVAKQT